MGIENPLLSVGIPIYNGERYIRETLESILSQTFQDFELIISDNASSDDTLPICYEYAAHDARIQISSNPENKGAAWNYNRVFQLSKGKYYKWAAADDLCAPDFFIRCIEVLERHPNVVLCYPRTTIIDENGQIIERYIDDFHLQESRAYERYRKFHQRFRIQEKSNPIFGVIRSSVMKDTQLIGKYTGSDVVFLGELAILGKIYEIPEHLFFRRDHPQASVRAYNLQQRASWFDPSIREKYQYARWRLLVEHLKSVNHMRLGWRDKFYCYMQIGQWAYWNNHGLRVDSIEFIKRFPFRMPEPVLDKLRSIWRSIKIVIRESRS